MDINVTEKYTASIFRVKVNIARMTLGVARRKELQALRGQSTHSIEQKSQSTFVQKPMPTEIWAILHLAKY